MDSKQTTSSASYYIMRNGFILRLEQPLDYGDIPVLIKSNLLEVEDLVALNQEQANYRVAIFRDEILELDEYTERVYGQSY